MPTAPPPADPALISPEPSWRVHVAGVVTGVVGSTSSFAVVLAGLTAAGASPAQAASGLTVLFVMQGLGTILLAQRHRLPVVLAWSTPGAALLAAGTVPAGGWPAAVGAFALTGVLLAVTAAVPALGDAVARIPAPLAQAMLAGVLVPLCLAPVRALVAEPLLLTPVVLAWLVVLALRPRLAPPASILVALAVTLAVVLPGDGVDGPLLPHLAWTTPTLTWAAVVGVALPLYVVTMAAQNVPGAAVLSSFGYPVPWRSSLAVTGATTVLAAPFCGHALNLAAISAALAAGPDGGPDPARRWLAARTAGLTYLVLALASAALTALVLAAPGEVLLAAAGLALVGTLGSSLGAAVRAERGREAAVVTFVVAVSGVTIAGVGAALWALLAGLAVHGALALTRRGSSSPRDGAAPAR
ncbi:benzoate/H(+) symporter BenE family transporter [Litorihabitans aurantiacus]|uniref:benzoate/H(+) symporter BenE family transporter n=1 Tax=Litorihabitans aurantiacus TaxID=1930061 RepID=UPI0024E0661A|nr:benzoate/H(+) symporter BenE family transporter [Litorihabitans aurantiacus]